MTHNLITPSRGAIFQPPEVRQKSLKTKIALYFQSLARAGGGAEKQLIWLATSLQKRDFDVVVITWDASDATSFYPLPDGVTWHKLDFKPGLFDKVRRLYRLTKLLREEKIKTLVGFVVANNKVFILSGLMSGVKMVASERNSPQIYRIKNRLAGRWMAYLSMLAFYRITVQFGDFVDGYPRFLRRRIVAISNPIFQVNSRADPGEPTKRLFRMLFVGRFDRTQKQPGILLDAFCSLAPDHQDWELIMLGDGDEKVALTNQVIELGLQDQITLLPSQPDIGDFYQTADLFVIPSLWEGSPNALSEAMAYGLPAVGFEVDGVKQLIEHKRTGWLCPAIGTTEFAQTLTNAMQAKSQFREFGQRARDITKAYSEDSIGQSWNDLILSLEE